MAGIIFIYHTSVQTNELKQKALAARLLKLHTVKWALLQSVRLGLNLLDTYAGRLLKLFLTANKYEWDGLSFSQE